jgi:quercetin dioxygenase-like cupin family protein
MPNPTVLEGAILSHINNGRVTTYKAGQSFSELPGDRHGVSANASKTKPAKLLAMFVVDTNETELTIPFGSRGHSNNFGLPNNLTLF